MRSKLTVLGLLAAIPPLGVGTATAGSEPEQGCNRAGCESAVRVELVKLPDGAAKARVCSMKRCQRAERVYAASGPDYYAAQIYVPDRCKKEGRVIRVGVRVFDGDGAVLQRARRRARLHKSQPNGPNCTPTCYSAGLTYRGDTNRLKLINP